MTTPANDSDNSICINPERPTFSYQRSLPFKDYAGPCAQCLHLSSVQNLEEIKQDASAPSCEGCGAIVMFMLSTAKFRGTCKRKVLPAGPVTATKELQAKKQAARSDAIANCILSRAVATAAAAAAVQSSECLNELIAHWNVRWEKSLRESLSVLRKKSSYWEGQAEVARQKVKEAEAERDRMVTARDREIISRDVVEKDKEIMEWQQEAKRQKKNVEETVVGMKEQIKDYQQRLHTMKAKVSRIPNRLSTAVNRVTRIYNVKADEQQKYLLKADGCNGTIPDDARAVICDLVSINAVPANKVTCVFKR
ncbi:hypothetical protein DFH05DRAFT_1457515 [Lentinula detonsa]|uniref:Uncharacterized protein n=1 Tax=Lentinula detonsa TaxID=2804962 RepID=A0A9W8P4T6_9AGAR|nr:hypothetical protein DFH05DRAFT_1457515 [Lentinula detonsa]